VETVLEELKQHPLPKYKKPAYPELSREAVEDSRLRPMDLKVEKLDHEDAGVRQRIFDFLAPYEPHCLFITGNLKRDFPDSHIYAAGRDGRWLGLTAYYGMAHSLVPFALEPRTVRVLARHVGERHPEFKYLVGISSVAGPAFDELSSMGYSLLADPKCVFMQMDHPPPRQPWEELVRPMQPADRESVARLHRYLRQTPQDLPVTEEELQAVSMNPSCYVLETGGETVATALTNGMGISSFQILGVATNTQHRNQGYARAVCAALMRDMWAAGARCCVLFTEIDNLAAQACYRRLGFRVSGEYWMCKLKTPD
jgi:RimJ/RimL family protein N-acetyltransferase